jgi:hypothetical protein
MSRFARVLVIIAAFTLLSAAKGKRFFSLRILQDGVEIPVKKDAINLSKKPFVIELELYGPMGILVSASFDETSYKLAKDKKYGVIPGFHETGMAEDVFNKSKEIMISDQAPNYWFYDSESFNRFDSVQKKEDHLVCTRTVEQLNRVGQNLIIPLDKVPGNLYLVFLLKQRGKSEEADKELQRERLMIRWK